MGGYFKYENTWHNIQTNRFDAEDGIGPIDVSLLASACGNECSFRCQSPGYGLNNSSTRTSDKSSSESRGHRFSARGRYFGLAMSGAKS